VRGTVARHGRQSGRCVNREDHAIEQDRVDEPLVVALVQREQVDGTLLGVDHHDRWIAMRDDLSALERVTRGLVVERAMPEFVRDQSQMVNRVVGRDEGHAAHEHDGST